MSAIITPNMALVVPSVGTQPGPDYAQNVNASLNTIDGHNHTPGYGVQIPPSGLIINADLPFNGNSLLSLASAVFSPQITVGSLNSVYVNGVDLFYNDGNGNPIQLTIGGSIAGSTGNITGLVSPASVAYGSDVFTFQSDSVTNIAGELDAGTVTVRKMTANSPGISITAPTGLSADYSLTLPVAPPATNRYLTIDNSGNVGTQDLAGNQMATNGATGKLDFVNTFSTNGLTFNGVPILLNDSLGAGGIGLRGFLTPIPISNSPTLSLDASMILFRNTNGVVGAGSVGLYQDPGADDTLWIQHSTNAGTAYPIVVSSFNGSKGNIIISGRFNSGASSSGTGWSYTVSSTGNGTLAISNVFSGGILSVSLTPEGTVPSIPVGTKSGNGVFVQTFNVSALNVNVNVNFIAICGLP